MRRRWCSCRSGRSWTRSDRPCCPTCRTYELAAADAAVGVDLVGEGLDGVDVALEQAGCQRRADVGHHLDRDLRGAHADLGAPEWFAGALLLDVGGGEREALSSAAGRSSSAPAAVVAGAPLPAVVSPCHAGAVVAASVVVAGAAVVAAAAVVVVAVVVVGTESSPRPQALTSNAATPRHDSDERSLLMLPPRTRSDFRRDPETGARQSDRSGSAAQHSDRINESRRRSRVRRGGGHRSACLRTQRVAVVATARELDHAVEGRRPATSPRARSLVGGHLLQPGVPGGAPADDGVAVGLPAHAPERLPTGSPGGVAPRERRRLRRCVDGYSTARGRARRSQTRGCRAS